MKATMYSYLAIIACLAASWPAAAQDKSQPPPNQSRPPNIELTVPSGEYDLVELHSERPGAGETARLRWTYLGDLRDGRLRVDQLVGVREPGEWLELKDGRLTGTSSQIIDLKPSHAVQVTEERHRIFSPSLKYRWNGRLGLAQG
jgi:hypothetical protein